MRCFQVPRPEEELYNIIDDPYELINLANNEQYRATLDWMRKKLDQIRKQTNDSIPDKRTPDDFDRTTGLPTEARIRPRPSKADMMKKMLNSQ